MKIEFFKDNIQDDVVETIQKQSIEIIIQIAIDEGLNFDEIRIIWVTDEKLKAMHREFMDDDTYTDVITFHYDDDAELYISVDRAREVHKKHQHSIEKELIYYIIHGVLHLCGYDDHEEDEIQAMRAAENHYLSLI